MGEVVVVFVVARPGVAPDEAALDSHCLANIARFKRPKREVFVDALPKNNCGKVLWTELRERLKVTRQALPVPLDRAGAAEKGPRCG